MLFLPLIKKNKMTSYKIKVRLFLFLNKVLNRKCILRHSSFKF